MFLWDVLSFIWDIGDFLYDLYRTTRDWVVPFNLIAEPIHFIYQAARGLINPIGTAAIWVDNTIAKLKEIITEDGIWGLIKYWFPWLETVGEWFSDWWGRVLDVIGTWWETAKTWVGDMISSVAQVLHEAIDAVAYITHLLQVAWSDFWNITWPAFTAQFDTLATAWDDFWVNTYPTIVHTWSFGLLFENKIKDYEPFWSGWSDIRDRVFNFFSDPLGTLLELFEDWFWGPE